MKPTTQLLIIQTVKEYETAFAEGCPYRILSAKYAKALRATGLPEALNDLQTQGLIRIWLHRSGGKTITTTNSGIEVATGTELLGKA